MMTGIDNINIAIVDNDFLVVQLLKDFFEESVNPTFKIVLTANSGNDFLSQLPSSLEENLDIILLDIRMDDGNGFMVLEQLQKLAVPVKVIVLSSYCKPSYIGQIINLGAHAFLAKGTDKKELLTIIKEVYYKGHYFTDEQLCTLRHQIAPKSPKLHLETKDLLTNRELEVLRLVVEQYTTKEIAKKLFITTSTVEAHRSSLLSKTGVKNIVGLVVYAIQHKIVNSDNVSIQN